MHIQFKIYLTEDIPRDVILSLVPKTRPKNIF